MDNRRAFLKKSMLLSGAAGVSSILPASIQRALAIDPHPGSTFLDAEHVVILMQENRSFDHCFGTLKGVRGFDIRDIKTDKPSGGLVIKIRNTDVKNPLKITVKDNSYKQADLQHIISKNSSKEIFLELGKNHNWYDFSIKVNGFGAFEKRYAGRVENGEEGFSDPLIGSI